MTGRDSLRAAPDAQGFFVRICGHRFVLTATCEQCRRYSNWRLKRKLDARREARRATR